MKDGYRVIDCDLHVIDTFTALAGVGTESKRKIMWEDCARLHGFDEAALKPGEEVRKRADLHHHRFA